MLQNYMLVSKRQIMYNFKMIFWAPLKYPYGQQLSIYGEWVGLTIVCSVISLILLAFTCVSRGTLKIFYQLLVNRYESCCVDE